MRRLNFGEKLTKYRQEAGYTLREFSREADYDPSNVSKIERGVIAPPASRLTLRKWAKILKLDETSANYNDFVSAGVVTKFTRQLKTDKELVKLLPAFCRTIDNKKVDPGTYKKLLAILRQNA